MTFDMDINEFAELVREPSNVIDLSDKAVLRYKNSDVFILNSFFKSDLFDLIKKEINDIENNIQDYMVKFEDNRYEIDISKTTYLNKLRLELSDEKISKKYLNIFDENFGWNTDGNNKKLSFTTWVDVENFDIPLHYDNNGIEYSIQIYLSEYKIGMGTALSYSDSTDDTFVNIGFVQNGGYAMKNSHDFYHGMEQKVPANYNRVSLYFIIR